MRVQVVDPPAYTPPYDRALCAALARAGADVELVTTRFPYGPVPESAGYRVSELFYPRAARLGNDARGRRALRIAEHLPGMLRLRSHAEVADLVHFQWSPAPALDAFVLPRRPRVLTVHDPPPVGGPALAAQRRLCRRMDAVIALSEHGAGILRDRVGLAAERVRMIPHGVFDYLTELPDEAPLPPELGAVEGPVVLFFGLLRPYKGVDVLLRAFRGIEGAELWVVGRPFEVDPAQLRALAKACDGRVRFVSRFVDDSEIPALFRRAEVVVLPYRHAEQSGVLYTAIAFGKAIVVTDVGGFTEVAEAGSARLVPPEDPEALAAALTDVLGDPAERRRLEAGARAAAAGPYSWDSIAQQHLTLYRELASG